MPPQVTNQFLDTLTSSAPELFQYFFSAPLMNKSGLDSPFSLNELKGILYYIKDSSPGNDGLMEFLIIF